MDKELVKTRFGKSLQSYRSSAVVQQRMASRLMSRLVDVAGRQFPLILEVGSGAGLLTERVKAELDYKLLYCNDIIEQCAGVTAAIEPGAVFIGGDIEEAAIPGKLDLVISNAVFQWASDIKGLFARLAEGLAGGGILAFTTFGPDNFKEFSALGVEGLPYFELEDLKSLALRWFEPIEVHEERDVLHFENSLEVLRHVHQTGVNSIKDDKWTRGEVNSFLKRYNDRYMGPEGVPLTYNPHYLILRRKRG